MARTIGESPENLTFKALLKMGAKQIQNFMPEAWFPGAAGIYFYHAPHNSRLDKDGIDFMIMVGVCDAGKTLESALWLTFPLQVKSAEGLETLSLVVEPENVSLPDNLSPYTKKIFETHIKKHPAVRCLLFVGHLSDKLGNEIVTEAAVLKDITKHIYFIINTCSAKNLGRHIV